ncbi:MAG: hypothetical protein FWC85_02385 [Elusimicrobia bacterium]|nr:hypothetical protein [Elusimicrobiota bacterium]
MTKETKALSSEITKVFAKAVKNAQKENREMGLPNVFYRNGRIVYELPDGKVTSKRPKRA